MRAGTNHQACELKAIPDVEIVEVWLIFYLALLTLLVPNI